MKSLAVNSPKLHHRGMRNFDFPVFFVRYFPVEVFFNVVYEKLVDDG